MPSISFKEFPEHYDFTYEVVTLEVVSLDTDSATGKISCVKTSKNVLVKKTDMAEKKLNTDQVTQFIRDRLINLIGVDFDKTLSVKFMCGNSDDLSFTNLQGGKETQDALKKLKANPRNYLFIATNNYEKQVDAHLKAWEIRSFFSSIQDRPCFEGGDKANCFQNTIKTRLQYSRAIVNGYLNLNATAFDILGIKKAIFIDDSKETIGSLASRKFIGILVDPKNPTAHWKKLEKFYAKTDVVTSNNNMKLEMGTHVDLDALGIGVPLSSAKKFQP